MHLWGLVSWTNSSTVSSAHTKWLITLLKLQWARYQQRFRSTLHQLDWVFCQPLIKTVWKTIIIIIVKHHGLSPRRCPTPSSPNSSSSFSQSLLGSATGLTPCPIQWCRPAFPYEVFPSCSRLPFSWTSPPWSSCCYAFCICEKLH